MLIHIGGHRHQHPFEPIDQCFDAGPVKHIGAELHRPADPGRITGVRAAFGHGEAQIHAGGLGVRRHLAEALMSDDRFISSKAERQAVNFKIQSSSAEMTKLAEGRMWRQGLFSKFDAVCYGPIHDEVVASVMISDLEEFLPLMHACMVAKYATMQVPIESSISFGPSFGEQIEIGIVPTAQAIQEGLVEMAEEFA